MSEGDKLDDKYHDPRSSTYRISTKLRKLISKALEFKAATDCPDDLKEQITKSQSELNDLMKLEKESGDLLNYSQIEDLHKYLQRILHDYDWFFYQLLQQCTEFKSEEKKENPELEQRLRKLKFEQSKLEYNQISNSKYHGDQVQISQIGSDFRDVNRNLIAVLNCFLVVVGSFAFVYKAVEYSLHEPNIPLQLLVSLIASVIVSIAELYFLLKII